MSAVRPFASIACLMGAAGVVCAAAASHGGGDQRMAAAAQILLVHAVASLAIAFAPIVWRRPFRAVLVANAAMQGGAVLFAADMARRTLQSEALFPMAAPIGGTILIGAWVVAALAFAVSRPAGQARTD